MYKGNEGKCYGNWDPRDEGCVRCLSFVRLKCESITKKKLAEESPEAMVEKAMTEAQKRNDLNEYFMGLVDSKLDRPTVNFGKPFSTYCYYGPEPKKELLLFVAWNRDTGKMKVVTPKVKKLVLLESTEQAEALAEELAG